MRESGHIPKEWIPIADAHIQVLKNLKQSSIDWTYFSPAGFFEPRLIEQIKVLLERDGRRVHRPQYPSKKRNKLPWICGLPGGD